MNQGNSGGHRLGGSTTTTAAQVKQQEQQMARRVPLSCCNGAACSTSSTAGGALAGVAAPFLVSVTTGTDGLGRPLDLAYWLGLQDSYSTKVPLSLKAVVSLIRTLEGRDKVTKTIQYASRFLWWYHLTYGPKGDQRGPRFEKMFRAAQTARKCFHLFRTLEELEKLQALSTDTKTPEWRRRALMVRAAAMAVYWFYDNTCFFINIKLSSFDQRTALTRDGAAWSLANAISIWLALYDLDQNSKERTRLEDKAAALLKARAGAAKITAAAVAVAATTTATTTPVIATSSASNNDASTPNPHHGNGGGSSSNRTSSSQSQGGDATVVADTDVEEVLEEVARTNVKRFDLMGDLLRASCDFVVACNSTGFDLPLRLLGFKLHDGVIGIAGLISAISAVYKAFPSDMNRLRKRRLLLLGGGAP